MKTDILKLEDYKLSTKKQIVENLKKEGYTDIRYSGKERQFYASK